MHTLSLNIAIIRVFFETHRLLLYINKCVPWTRADITYVMRSPIATEDHSLCLLQTPAGVHPRIDGHTAAAAAAAAATLRHSFIDMVELYCH